MADKSAMDLKSLLALIEQGDNRSAAVLCRAIIEGEAFANGGAQAAHIADPTGGATVDAEARTAIAAINVVLETYGLTASA